VRIAIFGAGGVGGYLGGRLAGTDANELTFIARGQSLEALQQHGLRLEGPDADELIETIQATDQTADLEPFDVVIIAVKAWQVPLITQELPPLVGPNTVVLSVQNGVETVDHLVNAVGEDHVLGGVCVVISYLAGPGHVHHVGGQPSIEMGALGDVSADTAQVIDDLQRAFKAAGIDCTISQDIRRAMWRKFLLITSYGGVGAVSRAPVGLTRQIPQTRRLIEEAMEEVVAVGRAHGVHLGPEDVTQMMEQVDAFRQESTASMQRDIQEGKPSELYDQSGAVVRLGTQVDIATPIHQFIYSCLLPAELGARGELSEG
jgi:2-dehydropantoate 2-reductase